MIVNDGGVGWFHDGIRRLLRASGKENGEAEARKQGEVLCSHSLHNSKQPSCVTCGGID